ncbi:hypothetical protein COCCADRAFT_111858 [Bipolaris zeicola 26-R-13]|uniref:Uncharacterized protein n=1 Tax=Cochliobolus carbonum (strain 26-R-13) TaxID=930089 RepID=W6XPC9_COCC2|nr:uncharacterized protein COCCADRAFT_111858 [Bipolaris zeicola 26-R-13]EUC27378.1 hypothetical protein COCCADRAFT_111858 [Bipolaris zeicola 26-R-13]
MVLAATRRFLTLCTYLLETWNLPVLKGAQLELYLLSVHCPSSPHFSIAS